VDAPPKIFVCLDRIDRRWELPLAPSPVESCLLGWRVVPISTHAGVPEVVAGILANTLVKHALVTFPTRAKGRVRLVHASHADDVRRAFDTEYFDWTQRGQVMFLSPPDSSPPEISESHLAMTQDGARLHTLAAIGVTGVVLPGVDGDVAGIYTFAGGLQDALLSSLRMACAGVGATCRVVTDAELAEELAD
jgi:hypothetical protein